MITGKLESKRATRSNLDLTKKTIEDLVKKVYRQRISNPTEEMDKDSDNESNAPGGTQPGRRNFPVEFVPAEVFRDEMDEMKDMFQQQSDKFKNLDRRMEKQHLDTQTVFAAIENSLQLIREQSQRTEAALAALQSTGVPVVAAVAPPAPIIQPLLGEPAGTVLKNGKGEVIVVEEAMFIQPFPAGAMTETARAMKPTPDLSTKLIESMTPLMWMRYAQLFAAYYTTGGQKPISSFWDPDVIETLADRFKITVTELNALTPQKQVYEILKAYWKKPDDNAKELVATIHTVELLPAIKGNVQTVVSKFVVGMRKIMTGVFTKALLDEVKKRVYIKEWIEDYKTKNYATFEDFYDHLKELAKEYDESTQPLPALTSTKVKNGNGNGNGNKNGNANGNGKRTADGDPKNQSDDQAPKCSLCGGSHWALQQGNDYDKPYGKDIKWACPDAGKVSDDTKRKAWESRVKLIQKRRAQRGANKASGAKA